METMNDLIRTTLSGLLAITMILSATGSISAQPSPALPMFGVPAHGWVEARQEKSEKEARRARELYEKGEGHERAQRWAEAIDAYRQAIEIKPDFASAY